MRRKYVQRKFPEGATLEYLYRTRPLGTRGKKEAKLRVFITGRAKQKSREI